MDAAPATAVTDVVEMLAGPAIMHMVHSHAGANVACRALALGTAKQRKKVIKAMKGAATARIPLVPLIKEAAGQGMVSWVTRGFTSGLTGWGEGVFGSCQSNRVHLSVAQ